jgi:hypothetical protein
MAAIMPPPVTAALTAIPPGASETTTLHLPAGRWDLSLQYLSPLDVRVSVPGGQVRMPAYVDRPGPFFAVTSVTSTGAPIPVTLTALRPSSITGPLLAALVTALAAVRSPDSRTLLPMRQACGRYIDWFRLQS